MITKQQLTDLLAAESYNPVYDILKNYAKDTTLYLKQYDPKQHKVHDPLVRKDKSVFKPTGILKTDGTQELREHTVFVARISLPIQQNIVKISSGILCGNPITLEFTGKDAKYDALKLLWDDNKLDYKSKRLAKLMMAETECAELWYDKDGKKKMLILSPSYGDTLHPVFDNTGDMIAFGRSYEGTIYEEGKTAPKPVKFLEIYDEANVWAGHNGNGQFDLEKKTHGFTKIPIVYYSQDFPEWWEVQESIERVETILSNLADTNDYFGSPTAVASGNILSYADKGESGKMIQLDDGAEVKYLTWDQVPEAIKLELETHVKNIFGLTSTVRLTPEELKGLFGSAPSGYAIKLMFTAAHMKASEHEENFGESIQRRINLLKSFVGGDNLDIKPKFTYFLPKNDTEDLTAIVSAKNNGTISNETAIRMVAVLFGISDVEAELELIKAEKAANDASEVNKAKQMASITKPFGAVN